VSTVTKKTLTDRIAELFGEKRVLVKKIVQRFLDEAVKELEKGNRIEFRDFGVFEVRTRKPRMAQNPRTLERVPVPITRTVKFKTGRLLKDRLQKSIGASRSAEKGVRPSASSPAPPPSP